METIKNIEREQIHLEWRGQEQFYRMAVKVDFVFMVKMKGWWPKSGRQESCLLEKDPKDYGLNLLLRGNTIYICQLCVLAMEDLSILLATINSRCVRIDSIS